LGELRRLSTILESALSPRCQRLQPASSPDPAFCSRSKFTSPGSRPPTTVLLHSAAVRVDKQKSSLKLCGRLEAKPENLSGLHRAKPGAPRLLPLRPEAVLLGKPSQGEHFHGTTRPRLLAALSLVSVICSGLDPGDNSCDGETKLVNSHTENSVSEETAGTAETAVEHIGLTGSGSSEGRRNGLSIGRSLPCRFRCGR
jgi:hypothetical protein